MPRLSILLPHKKEPENDKALRIALDCIVCNTRSDYELLVDTTTPADPYVVLNSMADRATADWLFFTNSDIFVSPGWDLPLLALAERGTMVTATLVECGAIGVHDQNIHMDWGMTPATFNREGFEAWVNSGPAVPGGEGFVYYLLMSRKDFLSYGKFDTRRGGFPTPLDSIFWEMWKMNRNKIVRAASFVYHLQNYSNLTEQTKAVRHGG